MKRLGEALLTRTHNICFHGEIEKILSGYLSYRSGLMYKYLEEGKNKNEYIFSTSRL